MCSELASKVGADEGSKLLLSHKNSTIRQTESPASLGLTTADIIGSSMYMYCDAHPIFIISLCSLCDSFSLFLSLSLSLSLSPFSLSLSLALSLSLYSPPLYLQRVFISLSAILSPHTHTDAVVMAESTDATPPVSDGSIRGPSINIKVQSSEKSIVYSLSKVCVCMCVCVCVCACVYVHDEYKDLCPCV